VLKLREAQRESRWDDVETAAGQLLAGGMIEHLIAAEEDAAQAAEDASGAAPEPSKRTASAIVSSAVRREAMSAQDACDVQRCILGLRNALMEGRITGSPGMLRLHSVSSAALVAGVR